MNRWRNPSLHGEHPSVEWTAKSSLDATYPTKGESMRPQNRILVAATTAAMAFTLSAVPAQGAVTELSDNVWFIGKGDVQTAFGWDAKTTDTYFDKVGFRHIQVTIKEVTCVSGSGNERRVTGVSTETSAVTKSVAMESRRNGSSVVTGAFAEVSGKLGDETRDDCAEGEKAQGGTTTHKYEALVAFLKVDVTSKKGVITTEESERIIWSADIIGGEE
jgi:hypothetical protein